MSVAGQKTTVLSHGKWCQGPPADSLNGAQGDQADHLQWGVGQPTSEGSQEAPPNPTTNASQRALETAGTREVRRQPRAAPSSGESPTHGLWGLGLTRVWGGPLRSQMRGFSSF